MTSVSVRIAGANGDGVDSSGALLIKIAGRNGLNAFGYRGYQSIIRGGHVWYQIRIGDEKLYGHGDKIDILIALNQDAINNQKSHLTPEAFVIYDNTKVNVDSLKNSTYKLLGIPLLDIAVSKSGDPIMRNTVAIGAAIKLLGIPFSAFELVVKSMFGRKGEKVVKNNIDAASAGFNAQGVNVFYTLKGDGKVRYSMDGNTALSIAAYTSGCKFYSAYPMTPASGILH